MLELEEIFYGGYEDLFCHHFNVLGNYNKDQGMEPQDLCGVLFKLSLLGGFGTRTSTVNLATLTNAL